MKLKEKNKKKKIKIRKSLRITYIILILVIIVISLFSLYEAFNSENNADLIKANIYEYTNNYLYSYDVSMIENDYINDENITEDAYITSLIDNVLTNMTYTYSANQVTDLAYSYQIIGKLEATYSKDGTEQKVWEKTDELVPMTEKTVSSDMIEINENIDLDLNNIIQLINDFQQEVGVQVDTTYTVLMEVTVKTEVLGQEVVNIYSPDLVFEIGTKTTTITSTTENTAQPQVVTQMIRQENSFSQVETGIETIIIVIAIVLLIIIWAKTENNNIIKNEYKIELNKILKGCEEKIVEVNSRVETEGQNVVDVRDFEEIIKVSEELFKPILYWNNDKNEESQFFVVGNNMVYRYVLRR